MLGLRTFCMALLTLCFGMAATSASQDACRQLGVKGAPTSGIEQVCKKPDDHKSWGELLADYIGYRGYSKSYALVVGVSDYTGGYDDLPTANDVFNMRDFLINEAGFDYIHVLTDGRATVDRVNELMDDEFPKRLDADDRFLFYWSGHGVTRRNQTGGNSGYLPVTGTPKDKFSKMINMNDINRWVRHLRAQQSLFLLDACFSGLAGSISQAPGRDLTIDQLAQPSHHLLTAGTGSEEVIAGDWWGGSLFTASVLQGLQGAADTASRFQRDGVVSLHELVAYVKQNVAVEKKRVNWKSSITPQLRTLRASSGEFFFLTPERKWEQVVKRGFEPSREFEYGEPVLKSPRRAPTSQSPELIQEAQEVLTDLGYRPGPVDGVLGIRTRGAIRKFQQDASLKPSGKLDAATLNQLEVAWSKQPGIVKPKLENVTVGLPPSATSRPKLPKTITNRIGMEFVLIPEGEFTMGSPASDTDAFSNEKPTHQVTISKPFYMGKYEVTQAQWQAVMDDNPSRFKGGDRPVEKVSWDDVQAFIKKLNEREKQASGVLCRLPTEAEWEYAARAGTTTRYSFGDDADKLDDYAWYDKNSGNTTHPVGQKKPNVWGLYDMHGNVWEWMQDWYGTYAADAVADPGGPATGAERVMRGSGWAGSARHARSADRDRALPGDRLDFLGFRCLSSALSK